MNNICLCFLLDMDVKLQIADVQNLVKQLPVINKATLKFFIEHIARYNTFAINDKSE